MDIKDENERNILIKKDIIKLMSIETGYSLRDCTIFLNAFIDVIDDLVFKKIGVSISNLFVISYKTTKPYYSRGIDGKRVLKGGTVKVNMRIPTKIAREIKEDSKKIRNVPVDEQD